MTKALLTFPFLAALAIAGPAEFGWAELRKAAAERNLAPRYLPLDAAVEPALKAEAFEIQPARISGGDLRGLMYGLLEAAEQIRSSGKVTKTKSEPVVLLRSVRLELTSAAFTESWFHSRDYWESAFQMMARARINRLHLEFDSPPFPYLFRLPLFDGVFVDGLTPYARGRNLDAIKQIAELALDYAVDLAIGIRTLQTPAAVTGLTVDRSPAYYRAALETLLAEVHAIRVVAIPSMDDPLRRSVLAAVGSIGRLVTIETDSPISKGAWRRIEELPPHEPLPPLKTVTPADAPVLRRVAHARFTDPRYVRLTARCASLGAMGIEVAAPVNNTEPDAHVLYFAWGRLSYDPGAADRVWRIHPLDDAIASAARTYQRTQAETELEAAQRIHSNAAVVERAVYKQPASPLVDALRAAATRARYNGRLLWGQYMLAYHRQTGSESALRAALRDLQAAQQIGARLQLPPGELPAQIAAAESMLAGLPPQHTPLPWTLPPPRPNLIHKPLGQSPPGKALIIPLQITPPALPAETIRLRYRFFETDGDFHTLEASARTPRFTIPPNDLLTPGTLLYYFELPHAKGVWLYPDPRTDPPVFQTRIKDAAAK